MVQGISLVLVTAFVVVNLLVDMLYAVLDPRVALESRPPCGPDPRRVCRCPGRVGSGPGAEPARDIRDETEVSCILISHNLAVVRQLTDETLVLEHGTVVERGPTARVLDHPGHPCTHRLRASVPRPGWKPRRQGL